MSEFYGLGTDIIEVERIKKAIVRYGDRFLLRIFTPAEREYCDKFSGSESHYAGRFAAKEAIFKALGTGVRPEIHWHDAEISHTSQGKPEVTLSKRLEKIFPNIRIFVSISHTKVYATATAIAMEV